MLNLGPFDRSLPSFSGHIRTGPDRSSAVLSDYPPMGEPGPGPRTGPIFLRSWSGPDMVGPGLLSGPRLVPGPDPATLVPFVRDAFIRPYTYVASMLGV